MTDQQTSVTHIDEIRAVGDQCGFHGPISEIKPHGFIVNPFTGGAPDDMVWIGKTFRHPEIGNYMEVLFVKNDEAFMIREFI